MNSLPTERLFGPERLHPLPGGAGPQCGQTGLCQIPGCSPIQYEPDSFVELIIDHLTQRGVMDAGALYEEPFTGIDYEGLDGVIPSAVVDEIVSIIGLINADAEMSEAA